MNYDFIEGLDKENLLKLYEDTIMEENILMGNEENGWHCVCKSLKKGHTGTNCYHEYENPNSRVNGCCNYTMWQMNRMTTKAECEAACTTLCGPDSYSFFGDWICAWAVCITDE